jgi:hypothetical protein
MGTTIVVTWTLSRYFYMMAGEGVGAAPLHHAAGTEPLRTLGPYALLIKLATGGMATVFVGNKYGVAGFERLIAVKCCHPHLRDDEEFVTMFLDERDSRLGFTTRTWWPRSTWATTATSSIS